MSALDLELLTVAEMRAAMGLPDLPAYATIYEGMQKIAHQIWQRTFRAQDLVFTFHPDVGTELIRQEHERVMINSRPISLSIESLYTLWLVGGAEAKVLIDSQACGAGQAFLMWNDGHLKHMAKWDVRSGQLPNLNTEPARFEPFTASPFSKYEPIPTPKLTNEQYARRRQRAREKRR